jgi:hypothetical protein
MKVPVHLLEALRSSPQLQPWLHMKHVYSRKAVAKVHFKYVYVTQAQIVFILSSLYDAPVCITAVKGHSASYILHP